MSGRNKLDLIIILVLKLGNDISITHLLNVCINRGSVPEEWKRAKVTPVYKYGSHEDPSNYRPISILPVLSKLLERAVNGQLYEHLQKYNLITTWQSGFRPNYSTSTALIYFSDKILSAIDHGKLTDVIYLDLKKVFNTVDIDMLLQKLARYGIKNNGHKWFTVYLMSRTQVVEIEGQLSNSQNIEYGVPHGSILEPLLFSLYINDLPLQGIQASIIMYTDNTVIVFSHTDYIHIQTVLNNELSNVNVWLDKHKLTLNRKKT